MSPSKICCDQVRLLRRVVLATLVACGTAGCATFYKPPTLEAGTSSPLISGNLDEKTDPANPVYAFAFKVDGVRVATEKSSRCDYDKRRAIAPGQHVISVGFSVGTSWTRGLVGYADFPLMFFASSNYIIKGAFNQNKTGAVWVEQVSDGKIVAERKDIELKEHPQRNVPIGFAAMVDSCAIP
jgi:hypothetical protein